MQTNLLYTLLLVSGLVLLHAAYRQYRRTRWLLQHGGRTTARVIDMVRRKSARGYARLPVFRFVTRTGQTITYEHSVATHPPVWEIGEETTVYYDPANPAQARLVGYWNLFRLPVLLTALALPCLITGGGYFLYVTLMPERAFP
jgi:hypothetical protein